jgi:ubiquinone/menaquinone biosynthesis C-methylase UbiE
VNHIKTRLAQHIAKPGGGFWGWLAIRLMIPRNRRINEWAVSRLNIQPADHVLEIGFGVGLSIARAARLATEGWIAGIDYSAEMVKHASQRNRAAIQAGRVRLLQGDIAALPYGDARFDKVFGVSVIYYLPDPVAALGEVWRVLKPGGLLVVMVRKPEALAENPIFQAGSARKTYSPDEAVAVLKTTGFSQAWIEDSARDETAFAALGIK